jgi:hypothetical protein
MTPLAADPLTPMIPVGACDDSDPPIAAKTASSLTEPPLNVNDCPDTHPIKGNKAGRQANRPVDPIYHTPASRWYAVTDPEECFATVEDAEAAGYRAPLR